MILAMETHKWAIPLSSTFSAALQYAKQGQQKRKQHPSPSVQLHSQHPSPCAKVCSVVLMILSTSIDLAGCLVLCKIYDREEQAGRVLLCQRNKFKSKQLDADVGSLALASACF